MEDGGCRAFGSGPDDGRLAARCTTRLQPPTEVRAVVREGVTKWHPGARGTRPGQRPGYPSGERSCRAEWDPKGSAQAGRGGFTQRGNGTWPRCDAERRNLVEAAVV